MPTVYEFAPARIRVLVADANDDLRLTLCESFESLNLAASSARNGAEAIHILKSKRHTFDIIFSDLNMTPGPSGLDVLRAARLYQPGAYVVVMTGISTLEAAIQSVQCGAFDYLAKPFRLEEIEIMINRIRDHINLLADNKRLSRRLDSLTERFVAICEKLDRIEDLLTGPASPIGDAEC